MKGLNVYIIDSHVVVRQILARIIRDKDEFIVPECSSGKDVNEVIKTIDTISPDVILLGIDEAASSQGELFYTIRKRYPKLPVIVMPPRSRKGARIAIKCLKEGAVDFITKPEQSNHFTFSRSHFAKRAIPFLKMIPSIKMESMVSPVLPGRTEDASFFDVSPLSGYKHSEIVVIGGCTGGVRSLYKVITSLPASFPVPVIIAQHMPGKYSEELSEDLNRHSALKVQQAKHNGELLPGHVYVAPGGYHTIIKNGGNRRTISLYRGAKVHQSRPSIDILFWSAAQIYGDKTTGILLSGEGEDGIEGAKRIAGKNGHLLAESRDSALLWDLPGTLVSMKLARRSYRAENLGVEIIKRVHLQKNPVLIQNPAALLSVPEQGHIQA